MDNNNQIGAKSKSDIILERFKKAQNKRRKKEDLWRTLDAYDRNEQWDLEGANIPPWVPKPVTNYIHVVKYTKRASLFMENATGRLRPLTSEDVEKVEVLNKVYEYTWDKINVRDVVRKNTETAKLLGTAIAHVYWNEDTPVRGGTGGLYEGEIEVREIDPACFYPDPNAFSLEDCEFIHIVERKPMSWIKKHPKLGDALKGLYEASVDDAASRGEIYSNRDYELESKDSIVDFHQHYEKIPDEGHGYKYRVTYMVGNKIILEKDDIIPRRYPFAILYDFPQRQDFWGKSTCEFILDNQKIINKVESIIAMIGTLMQNPQKIVSKESGINPAEVKKYGNAPGHTWAANGPNPSSAITYVQPPQIPTTLYNLLETAKNNIREITGLNQAYMGETVGSLQTSTGVQQLIERATMRDRDQMYDLEVYIRALSELLISFITTKYTEKRFIRIEGKHQGEYQFMEFIGREFADIDFDFVIDVSSKAPVSRMREQQEAKDLLTMQGQYQFPVPVITPQEFIEMSDMVHKDQLLERMQEDEIRNKAAELTQMVNMLWNMVASGQISPEEVPLVAEQMAAQQTGQASATGNTSDFQMRQMG
ncbi:portal protein [Paenibacillus phage SV21]|nr:portal protein [Paenibacillus phage SV21]